MVNLIITLISIALVAALVVSTVNYIPWYAKPAADIATYTRDSLTKVEAAYQVIAAANGGVAPDPAGSASAQAEFQSRFVAAVLKFTPAAPQGYTWGYFKYVDAGNPGSRYDGLHLVCLTPAAGTPTDRALEQGLRRATLVFSAEQVVLGDACGDTASASTFTSAPVVTMFLVASPEHSL